MKRPLFALLLAAVVATPLAALAQAGPPGGMGGPPPEMRAKMDAIHTQAKTDAYAALTPDHRAKVQAIVAQVAAGSLTPRDARSQIDALLSPDEQKSVTAVSEKTRAAMRVAFGGNGGPPSPPSGGSANAAPPAGGPPDGGHHSTPGGFLLRVSMTPEQMRALRAARPSPAP